MNRVPTTYYNEFDPSAVAWLNTLWLMGEISSDRVDTRSITEVKPDDVRPYDRCHFFAGIGGWELALQLAAWPATIPIWTASLPCQPFSVAGKGRGHEDERHLWPVFHDLVSECHPPVIVGEQVASKAGREWLAAVFADLEDLGYACAGTDLCAAGIGAPHIRQRLYWCAVRVGQSDCSGSQSRGEVAKTLGYRHPAESASGNGRLENASIAGIGDLPRASGRQGREPVDTGSAGIRPGDGEDMRGGPAAGSAGCRVGNPGRLVGDQRELQLPDSKTPTQRGLQTIYAQRPGADCRAGYCLSDGLERTGETWATKRTTDRTRFAYWDDAVWTCCLDGKWRPLPRATQPSPLPLADGLSPLLVRGSGVDAPCAEIDPDQTAEARMMRLRGYGNAIVPQLAAVFLETVLEIMTTVKEFDDRKTL